MLESHFAVVEKSLLALSQIAANAGHTIHRGTPREWFVRDFLESHLSERVSVGTGEIIDAEAAPREARNQIDVVIYRRDFPKLTFGGGINAFLAESVVATIEVKSILNKQGVTEATRASRRLKQVRRHLVTAMHAGYQPPGILSYMVAFSGPADMGTVQGWVNEALAEEQIPNPRLPPTGQERILHAGPALDGLFVLGKGFVLFDNQPVSFVSDDLRRANPDLRWVRGTTDDKSLLMLFLTLTVATSGVSSSWLDPTRYVPQMRFDNGLIWSV